jgi:hypothetical protein
MSDRSAELTECRAPECLPNICDTIPHVLAANRVSKIEEIVQPDLTVPTCAPKMLMNRCWSLRRPWDTLWATIRVRRHHKVLRRQQAAARAFGKNRYGRMGTDRQMHHRSPSAWFKLAGYMLCECSNEDCRALARVTDYADRIGPNVEVSSDSSDGSAVNLFKPVQNFILHTASGMCNGKVLQWSVHTHGRVLWYSRTRGYALLAMTLTWWDRNPASSYLGIAMKKYTFGASHPV